VRPEGSITRATYGLLNLTHRESHENPRPLEPGRRYRVCVRMSEVAQHFPAGHRIRLSVSTVYWPLAWPPPEPVRMTVLTRNAVLRLPVRQAGDAEKQAQPLQPPEAAHPIDVHTLLPENHQWTVTRDLANGDSILHVLKDDGRIYIPEIDLELEDYTSEKYRVRNEDPDSLRGETVTHKRFKRGSWDVSIRTRTVLTATPDEFVIRADLDAFEGEYRVFCRTWNRRIPRDLV